MILSFVETESGDTNAGQKGKSTRPDQDGVQECANPMVGISVPSSSAPKPRIDRHPGSDYLHVCLPSLSMLLRLPLLVASRPQKYSIEGRPKRARCSGRARSGGHVRARSEVIGPLASSRGENFFFFVQFSESSSKEERSIFFSLPLSGFPL